MATATQRNGKQATRKGPAVPSRDEVIARVRALGGEVEVKRYEKIEVLEKEHGREDVLHHWEVGSVLAESFREHDEETITVYSVGLQRAPQTLRLAVRLAGRYKEPALRKLLLDAQTDGHELNWAHFRQLMREDLTDAQRSELVPRIIKNRWGYRELQGVIDAIVGGKKSKGGRKPGKTTYKTYAGALSAMRLRSQAWLALEDDWLPQVKKLAAKLGEDEKVSPEFVAMTNAAAVQLRKVAEKANLDADEAEKLAAEVDKAMNHPKMQPAEPAPAKAPVVTAKARPAKGKAKAKPAQAGPRARLAKHPKMVDGKVVA